MPFYNKNTVCLLAFIFVHLLIYTACLSSKQKTDSANGTLNNLVHRVAPWMDHKVNFAIDTDSATATDKFTLKTVDGTLLIAANSAIAAATGFNWYLKYYCHRTISHTGDNMGVLRDLPSIDSPVNRQSNYPVRYALNYCTLNYTMSFWNWSQWERELDWMAMNGINLMLAPIGNEIIWHNVLLRLGCTDSLASSYAPGPAFTAWWLMGNLEGWQGPLSNEFLVKQMKLQQKILSRCRELGITPVMQGFYGMVPRFLKKLFPNANIISQGKWEGGFERSSFLDPSDPLFKKMSDLYYAEMQDLYGADFRYFGGDPFHEGGKSGSLDLTKSAQSIYRSLNAFYPDAIWVLQAWQGNPKPDFLRGFDKKHVLILDLFGESDNYWEQRKGYEGYNWLWCLINNFGEKTGMIGKLERVTGEPLRAKESSAGKSMKGIGIIPEGINNNAVVYDLFLETAWQPQTLKIKDWIISYSYYRYGVRDTHLEKAWESLVESVYSTPSNYNILGPVESVMLAKPSLNIKSVSTWGNTALFYDTTLLMIAANEFIMVASKYWNIPSFRYDCMDVCRQFLSDKAFLLYSRLKNDYNKKNKIAFLNEKTAFLNLILQQDSLCSLDSSFTLTHWLRKAMELASNETEKDQFIKNAKTQISYWGPDNPKSSLIDYANKQWSGMLRSYYYTRWKMFFDVLEKGIGRNNFFLKDQGLNFYHMEKSWSNDRNIFSEEINIRNKQAFLRNIVH